MKQLIVNAEDFGLNEQVNKGIVFAHQKGIVSCASLVVTKEGFYDAVNLAKQNMFLNISLQLDLDRFFNIDHDSGIITPLSVDETVADEAVREITGQIEKIKSSGLVPMQICSRHNIHLYRHMFPLVCEAAKDYGIRIVQYHGRMITGCMQGFNEHSAMLNSYGLLSVPHFICGWYLGNIDEEYTAAELVTHPGYGELWREYDITYCCNPDTKKYMETNGIKLINFLDYCASCQK
jgi:chitin disaccharide deacetylase